MLFDTHAHYDDSQFDEDRDSLLASMPGLGVKYIANMGTDLASSRITKDLADRFSHVYGAVGYHPENVADFTKEGMDEILSMFSDSNIRAVGEIGLDYHYSDEDAKLQKEVFALQLDAAKSLDVPVIIHERDACRDVLDILKASGVHKGVVHCFGGSRETAKILLDLGFHISFTGVITFKNARRAYEVVPYIPSDRIMAETDCPYLAPVPFRGKRNHSGYLKNTIAKMAEMRNISYEEAAEMTFKNAMAFYGIKE